MKNRLIVLFIVMLFSIGNAGAQVKFGIEAGGNFSHYLGGTATTAKQSGKMKAGFQIGVTADYTLKNNLMLISGISFLQTNSTMKLADHMNFLFPKTDIRLNNLILPLKIGYNLHLGDKVSLVPSIGVYGGYAFSAGKCDLNITYPKDNGAEIKTVQWKPMDGYSYEIPNVKPSGYVAQTDKFSHWDYGAIAGVKLIGLDHYTLSFDYTVGIKEVKKDNKLRNSTFQLSVGYRF